MAGSPSNASEATSSEKTVRSYTVETLKKLSMLSSNQCAFPNCPNRLVVQSDAGDLTKIVGHICHIYGASVKGPRGKEGLTSQEKNHFDNLILMCGHHHPIVDKLDGDYDADTLFRWKGEHEAKALDNTPEAIRDEEKAEKHAFFVEISDDKIEEELTLIRQGRFLEGFPQIERALALADQVERIKYSSGHAEVRARALAWLARILSQGDTKPRAAELLEKSKKIAPTPEADLAAVFFHPKEDRAKTLQSLKDIGTPAARSAMLRIVSNFDGSEAAPAWAEAAGLTIDSFDPEGKFLFIMNALIAHKWDEAQAAAREIKEPDYAVCPALMHAVAMTKLVSTIDADLRPIFLSQLPFDLDTSPIASDVGDLKMRAEARELFKRLVDFTAKNGLASVSAIASDFALWLGLRDVTTHDAALEELRLSMSDEKTAIRRVNFAIRFGLKVDTKAYEAQLDQNLALTGGQGSTEDGVARFALAFVGKNPKQVIEYVAKHREQLEAHVQKSAVLMLEVEALTKAGMLETAREKFEAGKSGLPPGQAASLNRVLSVAEGQDPIAARRAQYDDRKDLSSLAHLVAALEEAKLHLDLRPYAEELFRRTKSIEDGERVACCLNDLFAYDDLALFMAANKAVVAQSQYLKLVDAWTYYREVDYKAAKAAMAKLSNDPMDPNIRRLRVNIAIATGAWDELLEYVNDVWANRASLDAGELLQAAQLSVAVNGAHAKELVIAAAQKAPDDPRVLVTAYFQATSAGWEQDATVAGWIAKAAEKSGEDGPIQKMSLTELASKQPDWQKRTNNIWELLKSGKVPVFTAAQALNRSLLDFQLTPTLVNPTETDVRRRNIVFAYSGARGVSDMSGIKTLALDYAALLTLSQLGILETVIGCFDVLLPSTTLAWLFQEMQKLRFHQPSRIKDAALLKGLIANGTLSALNTEGLSDEALSRDVGTDLAAMLAAAKSRTVGTRKVLVIHGSPIHKIGSLMEEEADVSAYAAFLASPFAVLERLKSSAALQPDEEERAKNYLATQVRPWADEPIIDENTDVYLDGLAVSNLRAAGLLPHLKKAGVKFYVDKSEIEEADALLALESLATEQLDAVEKLRKTLNGAIVGGKLKAARTQNLIEEEEDLLRSHPTYGALSLTGPATALVIDDRFINQNRTMTTPDGVSSPVLTSLDLLDYCLAAEKITPAQYFLYRNRLRQWGYQLIPVTDDEIRHHLAAAKFENGELVETAGLKVIREALLRARMGKVLQLPVEMPFLQQSLGAFIRAMKDKWAAGPVEDAKGLGNYVLNLADIRGWATSVGSGDERRFSTVVHANHVLGIAHAPTDMDAARRAEYFAWIDDMLIKPIKDYQPEVFDEVVAQFKRIAVGAAEKNAQELEVQLAKDAGAANDGE